MSLYEQIGGAQPLKAAVEVFYARLLADPTLAPYFEGVDISRLQSHQRAFLTAAFDGPQTFNGRSLREAHSSLQITDDAFDATVEALVLTLVDLGIESDAVAAIHTRLEAARADIVNA